MESLIFEHPLNEKVRSYLRLEYLAQQLAHCIHSDQQHHGFYPLFALCEMTDRCDFKSEILKDLDKQIMVLNKWQELPQADTQQINALKARLNQAKEPLQQPERIGIALKQDKFICALKQKFAMLGACCNFDLPQLHCWLAKPWVNRQQDLSTWLAHFHALLEPVCLLLELSRSTAEFVPATAQAGFYQQDCNQILSFVRVKLPTDSQCYPTISGHRNRFAIHFVDFEQQKHSDKSIQFMLATCSSNH
ncbi:cell division protein ZapD [Shewanella sp. SR44-3]|uniref:cell division protein ZapD n=1 Tax=unclassified Shewanella TaxID=196818 RepID=UPI0015FC1F1D|nr:cell division protein ZapD [Shewanella sp. SR44-3]MBB1269339.1 cell division protein ZapD [Shewanella sp. SR44-3]